MIVKVLALRQCPGVEIVEGNGVEQWLEFRTKLVVLME